MASSPSPPPIPQRSPKRSTPRKVALQERSLSDANEISSRYSREPSDDLKDEIYTSTPYPTKPAHVLLPSTIRRQRAENGSENIFPAVISPRSYTNFPSSSDRSDGKQRTKGRRSPVLQLKRSVTTLRDMYEAQAEKSRPSTAASPALRPTSSSSRLRSMSSGEEFQGRYAWEALHKTSSDDLALLPSLAETMATVQKVSSNSSFRSRAARLPPPSSPNFITIGETSSPKLAVYTDPSSPLDEGFPTTSSSGPAADSSSSPNVVKLGSSSSFDNSTNQSSSSPNVVKLGSSSPSNVTTAVSTSSLPPSPSSNTPKKRKRESSTSKQPELPNPFASSPPYNPSVTSSSHADVHSPDPSVTLPTPPPKTEPTHSKRNSTVKIAEPSSDDHSSSSLAEIHANLQAVLESSPEPPIQYPVVKAPTPGAFVRLSVHKRPNRSSGDVELRSGSRLSTIPSEFSGARSGSRRSSFAEDGEDVSETSSNYAASQKYFNNHPEEDGSQVRIVPELGLEVEHPEASDEVSALPRSEQQYQAQYRSPPSLAHSSSFLGTSSTSTAGSRINSVRNSFDNRLNSMKSFTNSRHNSMRSSLQRPSSSSSVVSNFQIPSWARRYYSGVYRHSFHQLCSSAVFSNSSQSGSRPASIHPNTRGDQSSRSPSLRDHVRKVFRPRMRPRLEARQSHIEPGMGPLVSNPVRTRPPPPGATYPNEARTPQLSPSANQQAFEARSIAQTQRSSLHPADPRAHWAGSSQDLDQMPSYTQAEDDQSLANTRPNSSIIPRRNRASEWSPHLHRTSRSHLSWRRSNHLWHAPSLDEMQERWFAFDLRNAQVICFLVGFACPLSWFAGALLKLPRKPDQQDLEFGFEEKEGDVEGRTSLGIVSGPDHMSLDLEARMKRQTAKQEKLRWENARWWRGLNRFMCAVGLVVIILVIVLAILGTRGNWR